MEKLNALGKKRGKDILEFEQMFEENKESFCIISS